MKEEILNFIKEQGLSPFNSLKTSIRKTDGSIFKTTDAKLIFNKVLNCLSGNFMFSDTANLWGTFGFVDDFELIKKRPGASAPSR